MLSARARQPIIDRHSDVMIDVYRRRRAGERSVLARRHLPAHRQGGVVAAICTVGGDGAALSPLGIDQPYQSAHALEELRPEIAAHGEIYEDRSLDYPAGAETVRSMQNVNLGMISRGSSSRRRRSRTARRLEFGSPCCC